jgi:hypothetical protein
MMLVEAARARPVSVAEHRRGGHRHTVLRAVAHQLGGGAGHVGDADVLAGHQQVLDVRRPNDGSFCIHCAWARGEGKSNFRASRSGSSSQPQKASDAIIPRMRIEEQSKVV